MDKVANLDIRLEQNEQEREKSVDFFCERLHTKLFDTAFVLEAEVNEIVRTKREVLLRDVQNQRSENKKFVAEIDQVQKETFQRFEELLATKCQLWRDIKHAEALKFFHEDIQQMD